MATPTNAAQAQRILDERPARLKKWEPKRWQPEYEKIVSMSAAGLSAKEIVLLMATHHNVRYTKEHVSQILNTPQAEEFRELIVKKMRANTLNDLPKLMGQIQMKALGRVKEILDNDEHVSKSPFALMDRCLDVLKGVGVMKGAAGVGGVNVNVNMQQNNSQMNVPAELVERLSTGLDKANQVAELHANVSGADRR